MAVIKGGNRLNAALKKIAQDLKKKGKLRVGFLEDAQYPSGMPVGAVAAIQNYGAPRAGIPARPFFSNMVKDKSRAWPAQLTTILKSTNYDTDLALTRMGMIIKGQLEDAIIDMNAPPLSPITVMLRGMRSNNPSLKVTGKTVGEAAQRVEDGKTNYGASTKVLDDTGYMLRKVDYSVDFKS